MRRKLQKIVCSKQKKEFDNPTYHMDYLVDEKLWSNDDTEVFGTQSDRDHFSGLQLDYNE
ncbi:hypothetical protein Dda_9131 [Drechslerella dactyloides]|uniref:Uncharacterized protein n=1 Tax=Drechslerella dactyloides TaxID=74499 RepID=A0AAD6IQM8_DREDA|nr:hypothetical protein Dda_9131 [Drechslerella dactyloides]